MNQPPPFDDNTRRVPAAAPPAAPRAAPVFVWHYQAWCGFCLALLFLGQLSQGIVLTNALTVLLGVLALLSRVRWGPFYFVIGIVVTQVMHFFLFERYSLGARGRDLDVNDLLLAIGALGFVIGLYRLQGLWKHIWPPDPRQRAGPPRPTWLVFRNRPPVVQHRRREEHLRPMELIVVAFLVPALALLAMLVLKLTRPQTGWLNLAPGLPHLVILLLIALGSLWIVRHVMELWQVWTLRPLEALLFLQDQFWAQTRGEQRRMERWRAWKKIETS